MDEVYNGAVKILGEDEEITDGPVLAAEEAADEESTEETTEE